VQQLTRNRFSRLQVGLQFPSAVDLLSVAGFKSAGIFLIKKKRPANRGPRKICDATGNLMAKKLG
jgi:hypothetical protein